MGIKREPSARFIDFYKYAKTRLTLSSPFYGALVMNAQTLEVEAEGAPGSTAWTDGARIYFNEKFVEEMSRAEFTGVLLHEVLHVALMHVPRMNQYNPLKWNYATDYVINLMVTELGNQLGGNGEDKKIALPPNVLYDEKWAGYSSEQVYAELPDPEEQEGCGGEGEGEGCASNGNPSGGQTQQGRNPLEGDMHKGELTPEEMQKAKDHWQAVTAAAATSARMRGELPGGVLRELDELLYPKVDWRQVVMEFVQQFPIDYDWFRRDRRRLADTFIIPEMTGERIQLAVAVDTSGSIGEEELRAMLSETYGLMSSFGRVELIVMSCDAQVQTVEHITSAEDLANVKLAGGGGTRFEPVFEYLEENYPDTQALIYFTDGYGSYPSDDYRWKTLWVVFGNYNTDSIPFGSVVRY